MVRHAGAPRRLKGSGADEARVCTPRGIEAANTCSAETSPHYKSRACVLESSHFFLARNHSTTAASTCVPSSCGQDTRDGRGVESLLAVPFHGSNRAGRSPRHPPIGTLMHF